MGVEVTLRRLLKGFYDSTEINSVPEIGSREFGIGEFGKKISARHLAFKNATELNDFLREKTPFYISYSCARYELPAARPMDAKKMSGSDLIYEFDADDLKTDCKSRHDSWKCINPACGKEGRGNQKKCDNCGSGTKVDEWVCSECLGETKKQTQKLHSFLQGDFGFSEKDMAVNFSGSKGFHTHVRAKSIQKLSKSARIELLDYFSAKNLDLSALGFAFNPEKKCYVCPNKNEAKGWVTRLQDQIKSVFDSGNPDKLAIMGNITTKKATSLLKEKRRIFDAMDSKGLLLDPTKGADVTKKFWGSFLPKAIDEAKIEMYVNDIDRQTSVDINKIIRVPNTIHGSTGLLAKTVEFSALGGFDPLKESVVLPETEMKLLNATSPEFFLAGKKFGPFNNGDVSLPSYAAFFLLARGAAKEAL